MHRVYLHIIILCSFLFFSKNVDLDNIFNARIINRGTDRNIIT
jgi:hypothetical protein